MIVALAFAAVAIALLIFALVGLPALHRRGERARMRRARREARDGYR